MFIDLQILYHPCIPGINPARMWRKGNPSVLLVEMQIGAATMENSMEFLQKTKNGTAFWDCSIVAVGLSLIHISEPTRLS